jgi:hypothetical protein
MRLQEIRAGFDQTLEVLEAATSFVDGAIIIDEYDDMLFDDVLRVTPAWDRIDKRPAPGETTGGMDQSAIGNAASAAPRTLTFSAVSPTRAERDRKNIRAILMGRQFGIFDRSVGMLQNRPWSDLTAKDVRDMYFACMRKWNSLLYEGDYDIDPTEFSGLRTLLNSGAETITATESIVRALDDIILQMIDVSSRDVVPTAIYTTGKVVQMIQQEWRKIGDKMDRIDIVINDNVFRVPALMTSAGPLPIFADKFNRPIVGTPHVHPTFIVSEDKLSWQYVPVLGAPGAEPKTFEIALTNALNLQFVSVMFGAIEMLGGTNHHKRVNIEQRTAPVDMTTA